MPPRPKCVFRRSNFSSRFEIKSTTQNPTKNKMKIATIIARSLLGGLVFAVFGSNAFLHFIPMPPPKDVWSGGRLHGRHVSNGLSLRRRCVPGSWRAYFIERPFYRAGPDAARSGHREHSCAFTFLLNPPGFARRAGVVAVHSRCFCCGKTAARSPEFCGNKFSRKIKLAGGIQTAQAGGGAVNSIGFFVSGCVKEIFHACKHNGESPTASVCVSPVFLPGR